MNRLRVPLIRDSLNPPRLGHSATDVSHDTKFTPLKGLHILDVGCGGGILGEPLAALGARVLGIDEVPESVEVAKTHGHLTTTRWEGSGLSVPEYRLTSLQTIASEMPGKFDAVVASEVLEHVSNWEHLLHEAATCLKPGGMLFITTINRTAVSFLLTVIGAEYVARIMPQGTHEWTKYVKPTQLQAAVLRSGLQSQQLLGMRYNPLTGNFSWTTNLSMNYALSAVKLPVPATV